MTSTTPDENATPLQRIERLMPRAGVSVQLVSAACMWLIGSSILLVRGIGYVATGYWHAWALAIGLAAGVIKSHLLLERVAAKAVVRIRERGRASILGFFSLRSWALIAVMMGGGITLRRLVVNPTGFGLATMGAVYVGVGTALLLADRVFWHAVFPSPKQI